MSRSVTMPASFALEHDDRGDAVRAHRLGDVGERVARARGLHVRVHDLADEHRSSLGRARRGVSLLPGCRHRRWHDASMAKATYVANATVFDGRRLRRDGRAVRPRGSWVGARARRRTRGRRVTWTAPAGRCCPGRSTPRPPPVRRRSDFEKESKDDDAGVRRGEGDREREAAPGRRGDHGPRPRRMGGASIDVARAVAAGLVPGRGSSRPGTPSPSPAATATTSRSPARSTASIRCAARSEEIRHGATAIKLIATGGVLTRDPRELHGVHARRARGGGAGGAPARPPGRGPRDRRRRIRPRCWPASIRSSTATSSRRRRPVRWWRAGRSGRRRSARSAGSSITRTRCPRTPSRRRREIEDDSKASHRTALAAGVRTCATDAGTPFNAARQRRAGRMVDWGMRPPEALRAATASGAELRLMDTGTTSWKRSDLLSPTG